MVAYSCRNGRGSRAKAFAGLGVEPQTLRRRTCYKASKHPEGYEAIDCAFRKNQERKRKARLIQPAGLFVCFVFGDLPKQRSQTRKPG